MRGKPYKEAPQIAGLRIIPARAGQTVGGSCNPCSCPDHPRACGANLQEIAGTCPVPGSSPRVRGKRVVRDRVTILPRIIPARAGQTTRGDGITHSRSDHPRACGANYRASPQTNHRNGSSPRVRGKLPVTWFLPLELRIIPARAGQTTARGLSCKGRPDHPRACGANDEPRADWPDSCGSSPRVRGKRSDARLRVRAGRIIPARAGQTQGVRAAVAPIPDHPRACGANGRRLHVDVVHLGSSPRVRGKQSDFMRKLLSAGPSIIGFAQWLQSSCYCSCFQSSAKTPISRGTTPTSLFLGFQNSITLLLLT